MEVRRLLPEDSQQAIRLSDSIFRDEEQKSMGEAFPAIFSPDVISQSYGMFDEGKLIAFMGLVPSMIRIGDATLHVYSLGSVCTDPEYRGKGAAGQILSMILDDLQKTEASLLLVSGDRSLYTRVGCQHFGKMHKFKFNDEMVSFSQESTVTYREGHSLDVQAIARLADQRKVAYIQTPYDLVQLIHAEAYASCIKRYHKVLVAEKDGVQAFLVVGVPYGEDAGEGIVVEWAGSVEFILPLLEEAKRCYGLKQLTFKVPWQETELLAKLSAFPHSVEGNQGTLYIVNERRLFQQLNPYITDRYGLELGVNYDVKSTEDTVEFTINGDKSVFSRTEFLSFVFNPDAEAQPGFPNISVPLPYTAGLNYI
ncbi:GNAT superfamily N-acetyltransferase [Pullulanibacillus pueri]|uniref:N-acetyltransferase domain-containing protein n=1 Tax=Pullulanibacillus pueri TaxID=1437324 RepID=A0A8J2ZYP9_9BACL|nr:GNAT family N-acetyltransferase [Pullulanibacillus pueri]MBM7683667.1 GNAT superfamily N-acetyltransferase [Pullulanibacillus pueri]GGH87171.1 hypothetical protein GCM10007096_36570 [Pullulanibacillus pueri]